MRKYQEAYETHKVGAELAYALYADLCEGVPPPRVPGLDTVIRLAWRIDCGRDAETAAAREYLYRWNLAIGEPDQIALGGKAWLIWGAPHLLGA